MENDDEKNLKNERDYKESEFSQKIKMFIGGLAASAGVGAGIYGAMSLYNSFFPRFERPDYRTKPGIYNYELVKDKLPREKISFYSDGIRLQGYFYEVPNAKGLVVISHGMHAGADDYLPMTIFFFNNGYSVFSYDYKGTYDSDGKSTVGMLESLVDLNHAIQFVKENERFKGLKIFLVGHSWGAFASAAVLSLQKGISGAACIAGFNSGYTLIREKGFQYGGELASEGIPKIFLDNYQKELFKDYVNYDAVKGINSSQIPVFIAHGNEDKVISFYLQSIICHAKEIHNPKVQYYIGENLQAGHDSIWHSNESVSYQREIDSELKRISKIGTENDKIEFCKSVDNELYSQINSELFAKILNMFDSVL